MVLFYAPPAPAAARDVLNAEGAYGSRDLVHTSEHQANWDAALGRISSMCHMFLPAAINEYLPRPKATEGVNLLSGKDEAGKDTTHAQQKAAAAVPREIISWIKPNLTISLIDDQTLLTPAHIQPQVVLHMLPYACHLGSTWLSFVTNAHAQQQRKPPAQSDLDRMHVAHGMRFGGCATARLHPPGQSTTPGHTCLDSLVKMHNVMRLSSPRRSNATGSTWTKTP